MSAHLQYHLQKLVFSLQDIKAYGRVEVYIFLTPAQDGCE